VPQHKDVAREEGWAVPVNAGTYRFTITGPNGFRREFAGAASARAGSTADAGSAPRAGSGEGTAEVASRIDSRGRRLVLTLVNGTREDAAFTVGPNAYGRGAAREPRTITVRAGGSRSVAVPCASTHGWYDVTVARAADPAFRRRLMGHIENGAESVTG
jgi:phospholipase C